MNIVSCTYNVQKKRSYYITNIFFNFAQLLEWVCCHHKPTQLYIDPTFGGGETEQFEELALQTGVEFDQLTAARHILVTRVHLGKRRDEGECQGELMVTYIIALNSLHLCFH